MNMKVWRNVMLAIVILTASVIVLSCSVYNYMISPVSKDQTLKEVVIEKGSIESIGNILKENNLIRNTWFFKLYVKLNGVSNLKASTYKLSENMGVKKITKILMKGNTYNKEEISITFREGINMRKVVKLISENTNNKEEDIYALLKDNTYLDELISKYWFLSNDIKNTKIYYALEGYLFPDTYAFKNKDVSVKDIFDKMLLNMDSKLTPYKEEITKSKYSIHELITLASIVELEGASSDDRNGVAGVFYNRLNAGWTLGSDVTSYYGAKVDMNERELYRSELNDCNAYNTRCKTFKKLPVGPIANPGIESIEAVLNPSKHSYYYFVADKNKKTYFTKTEKEHNQIITKLKKENLWYEYDD